MTAASEVVLQKKLIASVRVVGLPKGQPRARAFVRGGKAAVYDPGTAEGWKSAVATAFKDLEGRAMHQPLEVMMTFYMPRPKSHYRTNGKLKESAPHFIYDKKPDFDNLEKAVADALTAIRVWIDDCQVVDSITLKRWEIPGIEAPGCNIRISELREVEF